MHIIPLLRCSDLPRSIAFYTGILDFTLKGAWPEEDPAFAILLREGAELHLSSHSGDGIFGTVFSMHCKDVDDLYRQYLGRGLDTSGKADSSVHQAPLWQSWGNREFYITDQDGHTLRLIQSSPDAKPA